MAFSWSPSTSAVHRAPTSGVSFDSSDDRIWVTDTEGYLSSYSVPSLGIYSSTRAFWPADYDDSNWSITSFDPSLIRPAVASRYVH